MLAAIAGHDWSGRDGYVTPLTVADDPAGLPDDGGHLRRGEAQPRVPRRTPSGRCATWAS